MNTPPSQCDLVFERDVDVAPPLIWRAWTEPALLVQWFTPVPWKTVECEIDLRPGGLFRTVLQSPDGVPHQNIGCFIDVVPAHRLVWTTALGPGFRPQAAVPGIPTFTASITLTPSAVGTRYTARAMHGDEESCRAHEQMGFEEGWGVALAQLVALVKTLK